MKRSYSVTVGTSSTVIVPSIHAQTSTVWAEGSILAGEYRAGSNGRLYWTPNGGTASEEPKHKGGMVTAADSIQWMAVPRSRKNLVLSLEDDSSIIYIQKEDPAVSGETFRLRETIPARNYFEFGGELNGISAASAVITVEYD